MNRLARERSPYLLQHASNPVDWYPWGDEAFAAARAADKPIFLSIGYSTCHWCHVMEHESFENADLAAVLNEYFVPVKVDREERPDVDRVYMAFVQTTTGSGGWPMSVWLTPDLKPFYGGTYFPPASRWGRPGFAEILAEIARVWQADRARVVESADALLGRLRSIEQNAATGITAGVPGADALAHALREFRSSFDASHGGFGSAPKFPRPSELLFLLREHARTGDAEALAMSVRTLRAMALGGMRDHVGGGFHRYSVDREWRVPHFEKMLYDQAQLALAFTEAAQASGDPFFAEVAEDTLRYVLREMTDPDGGFYSAEDADSVPPEKAGDPDAHKSEGAFYLWRADEVEALLGADAGLVRARFGIEDGGNAPADPLNEFVGKNLLYVARSIDELATQFERSAEEVVAVLERARVEMFGHRLGRPRAERDDKVLTAWNGLTIAALARLSRLLSALRPGRPPAGAPFLEAAQRAASFLEARMWNPETRSLLRRYRQGDAQIGAYAEDYAYLVWGLLELFQADADPRWLAWALALQERQDALFWDDANGGWFSTTGDDPSVLLRLRESYDGAEPTASSVSVLNLITLSHLVPSEAWRDRIERTLRLFGTSLTQTGRGVPMMAAALSTVQAGVSQVVIVRGGDDSAGLASAVGSRYLPFAIELDVDGDARGRLAERLPFIAAMPPVDGRTAVYVCRDFTCRQPVTTLDDLNAALGGACQPS